MNNKLIILCLLILLLLTGCSSSKVTENGTVNATTRIAYSVSEDKIKVSNVIIKCNDNYYGVSVNDSINYNSNNNYFTTGSGLTVMITSDKLKTGSTTKDNIYTATSKIEDNVYLYVSGSDKDKVNEIFNNVFKTNKLSYTFLAHDIDDDWTKEVNITEDVISFSNGTDTIYAYQNPGSLSDGCINGRIEPTVFKKALRGIDIPITYPEDTNDEWDYIPYGVKEYEHLTIDGYTPYSAYQTTEYVTEMVGSIETRTAITKDEMTNYILLAKNDQDILSLFNDKNDHTQTLYSLSIPSGNTETLDLSSNIDLSNMKDLASSVINSENRYHFGVLTQNDEDGYISYNSDGSTNQSGYYVDGNDSGSLHNEITNYTIANGMSGKLTIPTIKVSVPLYNFNESGEGNAENSYSFKSLSSKGYCYTNINHCMVEYDYAYASEDDQWLMHGATVPLITFLETNLTNPSYSVGNYEMYLMENDYAYKINAKGQLTIYKNVGTETLYGDNRSWADGLETFYRHGNTEYQEMMTCTELSLNGLTQFFNPVFTSTKNYFH